MLSPTENENKYKKSEKKKLIKQATIFGKKKEDKKFLKQ